MSDKENNVEEEFLDEMPAVKISKALKESASRSSISEIQKLVSRYYQHQHSRIQLKAQLDQINKSEGVQADRVTDWLLQVEQQTEAQLKLALDHFVRNDRVGTWCKSHVGIGPVIAAGIRANFRIDRAPTAGHFWNFAGLNPGVVWKKGQKRPWNAELKTLLAFKLGESFVKLKNHPKCFYGHQFELRKVEEIEANDRGDNVESALAKKDTVAKTTHAWLWLNGCFPAGSCNAMRTLDLKGRMQYLKTNRMEPGKGQPMLAPDHIHSRARRWTVKLFVSHLHEFWYELEYGEKPPAPYAIAVLGHAHKIERPDVQAAEILD